MWGMKTEIIPVVLGALLGLTKKRLEKHMDKIPGAINIKKLQKITLLGTVHKLIFYQPCFAIVPWFGPSPLGVNSDSTARIYIITVTIIIMPGIC